MAVDAEYVEALTGYVQGTDYTASQLSSLYLPWAEDDLLEDAPTLAGAARNRAIGYLVGHYIAQKDSNAGEFAIEKSGDWQGSRAAGAGETTWLLRYRAHLAEKCPGVQPSAGVERGDSRTSAEFLMSDLPLPQMDYLDETREANG